MYFKSDQIVDLDQEVNQKVLLGIISTISVFALHSVNKSVRLDRIAQTTRLIAGLCNIDKGDNREKLISSQKLMLEYGQNVVKRYGSTTAIDFANAIKSAIDMLSSSQMKHSDDWEKALVIKLKESYKMLQKKARSLEKKLQKGPDSKEFVFFDQQQKTAERDSKKLKTAGENSQENTGPSADN